MKIECEGPSALYQRAEKAVAKIVKKSYRNYVGWHEDNDPIMLVLGSGCGDVAENIDPFIEIDYADIKGMPESTVAGHAGKLLLGHYGGKNVVAFSGRNHYYEGNSAQQASYMVYVAHHLGAKVAIMTAAAGIAPRLKAERTDLTEYMAKVGDVMLVDTYFPNYLPSSLRGPIDEKKVGARFNGTINVPSMALAFLAQQVAFREMERYLDPAVYVPREGPNYETSAEVSMLTHLSKIVGLPALGGMSTVPELEAANMLRMDSLVLAVVTNRMFDMDARRRIYAGLCDSVDQSGRTDHTLGELNQLIGKSIAASQPSHAEVAETAGSKQVTEKLEKLIGGVVRAIRF